MSKSLLNFSDLENVVGGRVYAFVAEGVYVSDGTDAVIISKERHDESYKRYIDSQLVSVFKSFFEVPEFIKVGVFTDLDDFRYQLGAPYANYELYDRKGNLIKKRKHI